MVIHECTFTGSPNDYTHCFLQLSAPAHICTQTCIVLYLCICNYASWHTGDLVDSLPPSIPNTFFHVQNIHSYPGRERVSANMINLRLTAAKILL